LALIVAGGFVLHTAKGLLDVNLPIALATIALAFAMFGTGVKFLMQALSQLKYLYGRNFPIGLAPELKPSARGTSDWASYIQNKLRDRSLFFVEPTGPLNGILYSLINPLITAPPTIQFAAIRHFHAVVRMVVMLMSMAASYYLFEGNSSEGVVSWIYLPLTGLSLASPFIQREADGEPPKPFALLWNLVGLIAFAILAPVLVPKYFPHWSIAPMWIAPLAMLVTSIVASGLFLISLLDQIDGLAQTDVSCEQTTIAMNCAPSQLWAEIGRNFQVSWDRNIPNRQY